MKATTGDLRGLRALALASIGTPSLLILSVGILLLVFGQRVHEIVFGILIVSLAGAMVAGVAATLLYLRREAAVTRLQSEFVAKVSHDLRTPLTSIRMFVETLQMGRLTNPPDVERCLGVIATETERLTALIDRLLSWGRMEAGRRRYQTATHSVEALVAAACDAFAPQLLVHAATLVRDVPASLPRVDVDLPAMSEALLNLLQNAHRYTGDDKRIAIRGRANGARVDIEIEDNGPGIPPAEERRVFEKFYRTADAVQRGIPGSGLGLAIVQAIVQAHRGRIELRSRPGRGALFVISLPAVAAPATQAAKADADAEAEAKADAHAGAEARADADAEAEA